MNKVVVLKPIIWNTEDYINPSGFPSQEGFTHDYGYGHEEWNNNPKRVWKNYRIFHAQSKDDLKLYAQNGNLGLLMIASHGGKQEVVGIAVNVENVTAKEENIICKALKIKKEWEDVWKLEIVQRKFKNNQKAFLKFWEKNYKCFNWKCPLDCFYWFKKPILLKPEQISGKNRLCQRHASHQPINPKTVIQIIKRHLPSKKRKIIDWLKTNDFDDTVQFPPENNTGTPPSPSNPYEYLLHDKTVYVKPSHKKLQKNYVRYLQMKKNVVPKEDDSYVDVSYKWKGKTVLVEVKPTDKIETKYAIRAAVGQLLDYRYRLNIPKAYMEIVLGSKNRENEIAFVRSLRPLGITLVYQKGNRFESI